MEYQEILVYILTFTQYGNTEKTINKSIKIFDLLSNIGYNTFGAFPGIQEDCIQIAIYITEEFTATIMVYPEEHTFLLAVDHEKDNDKEAWIESLQMHQVKSVLELTYILINRK